MPDKIQINNKSNTITNIDQHKQVKINKVLESTNKDSGKINGQIIHEVTSFQPFAQDQRVVLT
uniref:Uncharacterized protein n=1 Tax=Arion vulgaris TaxID=1028688 RepID=A0A0B6YP33_9EUPU